ncbi:hypothetical protein ACHAWF_014188 [Thalassiosira exigua]
MRPLNSRESESAQRVWRVLKSPVLKKSPSVVQCTPQGKPLPERIEGRNFFTYDKTFAESSTTRQVYDGTSRSIVDGVVRGLNGTIFAYGQTSSGKTFTMQGAGTLKGGIVHMAAGDIFDRIQREPERVFLVRVSFVEIYNEEAPPVVLPQLLHYLNRLAKVRDLLVSGDGKSHATLAVREDKRRGVFVNSNEAIVHGPDSLLSVLFAGEENRSVASTGMNERSSRSHTIFRITVESRLKRAKEEGEHEDDNDDDSEAVRVSTLNLVDLAGSESVRNTGATGDRQKEGGKINQSLLTLSRIIASLGRDDPHVNFRDSKLTRILQPSLSGNARMAVICCATPSELYTDETRSTLEFAARAKLVRTRAQVNEVMDDRSLIKKLQRELKEAQKGGPGKEAIDQMKALEEKAAGAERANGKAEEDLKRMKQLILKGGVLSRGNTAGADGSAPSKPSLLYNSLSVYNDNDGTIRTGTAEFSLGTSVKGKKKRRYSDGVVNETDSGDAQIGFFTSPARGGDAARLQAQTEVKPKKAKPSAHILPSDMTDDVDIGLLREALTAKSAQVAALKAKLKETERQAEVARRELNHEHGEKELLRSQISDLANVKEFTLTEQDVVMAEKDSVVTRALERIEHMLEERKQHASTVETLGNQLQENDETHGREIESLRGQMVEKEAQISRQQEDSAASLVKMEAKHSEERASATKLLSEKEAALDEAQAQIATLMEESSSAASQVSELRQTMEEAGDKVADVEGKLEAASRSNADLTGQVASLENSNADLQSKLNELQDVISSLEAEGKEAAERLEKETARGLALSEELETATSDRESLQLSLNSKVSELQNEVESGNDSIESLTAKLKDALNAVETKHQSNVDLQMRLDEREDQISKLESATKEAAELLENETARGLALSEELEGVKSNCDALQLSLNGKISDLQNEVESARSSIESLTAKLKAASDDVEAKKSELEGLSHGKDEALKEVKRFEERNNAHAESFKDQEETLRAEIKNGEEMIDSIRTQKAEVEEALENANQTNDSLTAELKAMESSRNELHQRVMSLEEQASQTKGELTNFTEQHKDIEEELQAMKESKESLEKQLEEASENIGAKQLEFERLVQGKDEALQQLEQDREKSNNEVQLLNAEVKKAEEVIESLEKQKSVLQISFGWLVIGFVFFLERNDWFLVGK